MLGCDSRAAAWTSRRKRRRTSGWLSRGMETSGGTTRRPDYRTAGTEVKEGGRWRRGRLGTLRAEVGARGGMLSRPGGFVARHEDSPGRESMAHAGTAVAPG